MRPVNVVRRQVAPLTMKADFQPSGDQPAAIDELEQRIRAGENDVVLLGATGTGKTATKEEAQEVCEGIRSVVREKFGARVARSVSILYGGSMNPKNAAELLSMPDIDGGLIGGASLKPKDFAQIIDAVAEVTGEEQK